MAGAAALAVLVCVIVVGPFLSVVLPGDLIVRGMSPLLTIVVALASWAQNEKPTSLRMVALAGLVMVGLDEVVHQRNRLGLLALLSSGDRVEFGYLREQLGLTAGNLSRHLSVLEGADLVRIEKSYLGRRPRTWVEITTRGTAAFRAEVATLRAVLDAAEVRTG